MASPRPYLNLHRVHDSWSGEFDALFKTRGLSQPAYNVLRILRGAGKEALNCGQISERMVSRVPDVTRLVDRLEKRDLVGRSRASQDRRVVEVSITRKGGNLLHELDEPVARLHARQLGGLTPAEFDQLDRILAKLLEG